MTLVAFFLDPTTSSLCMTEKYLSHCKNTNMSFKDSSGYHQSWVFLIYCQSTSVFTLFIIDIADRVSCNWIMHAFYFSVLHKFFSKYRNLSYLLQHTAWAPVIQAHLFVTLVSFSTFFPIVFLNLRYFL